MPKSSGTVDPLTGFVKLNELGLQRFWSRINKNGTIPNHRPELGACWEWTAKTDHAGYGVIKVQKIERRCNRVMWMIHDGPIPHKLQIHHHCDNPLCCRLEHLWMGTQQQNLDDMRTKGRQAKGDSSGMRLHPEIVRRGTKHYMAKLGENDIREIRHRRQLGEPCVSIAKDFPVNPGAISQICRFERWKHI